MGSELAERLSSQCPRLKVIYTSGYSPGMAGREASLLKGRNFLPKPYSIGKLAQIVRECLDAPASKIEPMKKCVFSLHSKTEVFKKKQDEPTYSLHGGWSAHSRAPHSLLQSEAHKGSNSRNEGSRAGATTGIHRLKAFCCSTVGYGHSNAHFQRWCHRHRESASCFHPGRDALCAASVLCGANRPRRGNRSVATSAGDRVGRCQCAREIIPVINIRKRFGLPERELALNSHLIIARTTRRRVALAVDAALAWLRLRWKHG